MWAALGILAVTVLICIVEVPPLVRNQNKKEIVLYFIILLIGIGMNLAYGFDIKLPNPLDLWILIASPIGRLIVGVLLK